MAQPIPNGRGTGEIRTFAGKAIINPDPGPVASPDVTPEERGRPTDGARREAATSLLAALLASGRVGDREAAVGLAVEWADRLLEKLGR